MAKAQTNQATAGANSLQQQAQSQTAPIISGLQQSNGNLQNNQGNLYNSLTGAISQGQQTGGYNPGMLDTLRQGTANNAATGGYNPDDISGLKSSGGYDPSMVSQIQSGAGAGYDPTAAATIRGGYTDFANNGGFNDASKTAYMNQATAGVGRTSDALQQQAKLATQKSGGFGGAGAVAQIARQLGNTQAQAGNDALANLNTQVNSNKLAGLGGLNSSEANQAALHQSGAGILNSLAGNQANNKLSAAESEAGNKLKGTDQQLGLEGNVASGVNNATAQLSHLYDTTTGQITTQGQQILQAMGLNFSTQGEAINALTSLSKNPGMFQTILGDLTSAAGAAAGIGTGFKLNHNQVIL